MRVRRTLEPMQENEERRPRPAMEAVYEEHVVV
jgi:hypothetical protein